uniref:Tudor domain containing 1 n=1 Tax=Salarias fasciatus TaxID=181472 RepID=A0A672JGL6_SALFA
IFCNYCGQQGNFRCNSCKKIPYCSVVCQKEDWKAHKHVCTYIDEKTRNLNDLKEKKKPKQNFGADVQVQNFYSPGRFFLMFQSPEILKALTDMSTELQGTNRSPSVSNYVPCVGEVCAAQFSLDLKWYRGLIQTLTHDQKMAKVLYIDFGNEEDVPVDRIRPLAANIKPLSPCAMECCIAGVVPVGDKWSSECCTTVREMIVGKIVTACLVKTQEHGQSFAVDILLPIGGSLNISLFVYSHMKLLDAMTNASLENFRRLADGKDDNSWAQPPEPLRQAVGDRLSVVVIHFQSPTDFIVQKVENAKLIQDLQLKLREHCSQVAAPKNFRPAPGTVCCAQFTEDKQWYRATVLAYSSEERVCVGYIDFGNSEDVDLSHLCPISAALLELPMQAIPCGLAGKNWSEECVVALRLLVSNRILHVEILGEHNRKLLVSMVDETSDPQANMAEVLISAGYAAAAAVGTKSDSPAEAAAPAASPLVWRSAELPSDGQTVALQTTVVENPGEFYCHIDSPAAQQQLTELDSELKLHCEADATSLVPKVGDPCCALHPGEGRWCRGMVRKVSEDCVTVYFVDGGQTIDVKMSNVRSITVELLKLPFQAIRCWLAGVEPLESEWSSESLLFFLTLVDGQQLSARVLSVTEQGCGVELESKGQNVAAALISEQLARVPGELAKEKHVTTGQPGKDGEKEPRTEDASKKPSAEQLTAVSSDEPFFPVDWKAVELPLNSIFKPGVAAAINPSLFYVLSPIQVDGEKVKELMEHLAAYCSKHQTASSAAVKSRPAPGAACCAQFSDNTWYRAVVLEVGDAEAKVIYADYGNMETVPFSRILPIPLRLLQLPFQITRCTLLGMERFPAVWPEDVTKMFQRALSDGVFATVLSFDGSANVLSLTLPTESGGVQIASMIFDALHPQNKANAHPPANPKSDQTGSGTPDRAAAAPDGAPLGAIPKVRSLPKERTGPAGTPRPTQTSEERSISLQRKKSASAAAVHGWSERLNCRYRIHLLVSVFPHFNLQNFGKVLDA